MIIKSIPRKPLSKRQKECLSLTAECNTARSIAIKLGISIRMVRFHLCAARLKLNAVSTIQAVHIAAKDHLIE